MLCISFLIFSDMAFLLMLCCFCVPVLSLTEIEFPNITDDISLNNRDLCFYVNDGHGNIAATYWNSNITDIEKVEFDAVNFYCPQLVKHNMLPNAGIACRRLIDAIFQVIQDLRSSWVGSVGLNYIYGIENALKNKTVYDEFKSNEAYMGVVETVTSDLGHQYFQYIVDHSDYFNNNNDQFNLLLLIQYLLDNDHIGRPPNVIHVSFTSNHTQLVGHSVEMMMSTTTLRYWKVLLDLEHIFNIFQRTNNADASNFKIAEIGCGYGGQSQALLAMNDARFNPLQISYYYHDLDAVLKLISKYMKEFYFVNKYDLHYMNADDNSTGGDRSSMVEEAHIWYDMCISNYAISELNKDIQLQYIDNVLRFCKSGYITYNEIGVNGHTVLEFKEWLEISVNKVRKEQNNNDISVYTMSEVPSSCPFGGVMQNTVLIWGNSTPVNER